MTLDAPRPILLADYTPPAFLIDRVDLRFMLHPTATEVTAKLTIRRNPAVKGKAPLRLDGEHLELKSLKLDGKPVPPDAYVRDDVSLKLATVPDTPFKLETVTIINPQANTALQGLYVSRGIYCTQCEAEGFRRITYFLDRPDVLSVYTVRLDAEQADVPVLLANGNPVERGTVGGGRHYAVWRDPHPKPCYLFAIVGGDLSSITSSFTTMSGREVDLRIHVEHGKEARAHWAMDALKRSFAWDEKRFGREYDLDVFNIVAVSDFNMGAMENKGLNIFNDRLILASEETATDANYEAIESVVAHEYFHNWTGNRITCRDWFQLCLKEGLTVYRDQEFSADERSRTVQRITDVRQLKALQFPEDQGPLAHPVRPESYIEINNFYTPTVYEKGAEVVRMLETILGPNDFRRGMDLYFERHDGEAATIEDFLACFEKSSGRDLTQFKRWYTQAGTPELVCDFNYDKAAQTAELKVHQVLRPTHGQPVKAPLVIPLRMALLGANGNELDTPLIAGRKIRDGVLAVDQAEATFKFGNVASRPVPSLLRGFSAPVKLTVNLSDDDLAFLMTHDGDLFNRWQAANQFATRAVLTVLDSADHKHAAAAGAKFARALLAALHDDCIDSAYKAELLRLPTQSDIAREKGSNVNPADIDIAHRALSRATAEAMGRALEDIYAAHGAPAPFSPDAKSAGRRALHNGALTLLTARDGAAGADRVVAHYQSATNMTDQAHALNLVCGLEGDAREPVLAHFLNRWKDDHLVIDIWFAAQAQSPRTDTLARIESLLSHPLFKLATPNKVRALIGTFAMANPLQFNRDDGAGYDFLARMAVEIDALNPQIAARMLGAFRSYRALESKRQALAHAALERVAKAPGLSRDSQEMVVRMLDD